MCVNMHVGILSVRQKEVVGGAERMSEGGGAEGGRGGGDNNKPSSHLCSDGLWCDA